MLTLESMRQGVRDSDTFPLILSAHLLAAWFCQQEMLTAIAERKKIQLLVEVDSRFFPFPAAACQGQPRAAGAHCGARLEQRTQW